jgi:phage tail-like protein
LLGPIAENDGMPRRDEQPLLRTSFFRVLIDDLELGFAEVSPLSSSDDAADETGVHFETVVLRRALTRSRELYLWRRDVIAGKDDRRAVTIQQLETPDGVVANAWRLIGARPVRWSGPDFNAMDTRIAYEELELAFDDLLWLEETAT